MVRASRSDPPPGDSVTRVIAEWGVIRPDLDVAPLAILARVAKIRTIALARQEELFAARELTPADFVAIVTLRRRPPTYRMTQGDLAAALGLTAGTVSTRVDRLVEGGLVTRTRDDNDARVHWVELTPRGQQVFDDVVPHHLAAERNLLAGLSPQEQSALAALLETWLTALESDR